MAPGSPRTVQSGPPDVEFVDSLPYTGGKMEYVTSDVEH